MAEENAEICGFLDVKFFGGKSRVHKVRKRTLGPWKVWKRHWCSIKKLGPDLGVKVQLDHGISNDSTVSPGDKDTSIIIPLDAIICRTQSRSKQFAFGIFPTKERKPLLYLAGNSETESQRWMANIRQLLKPRRHEFAPKSYIISIIDNMHSKASGLTGVYGDLVTNTLGIIIKDIYSGETIQSFEWKELGQFHLITAGRPEDVKCICVIHTTKAFHGGVGELHVFCLEATKLLQDLVTQGRGPKNKQMDRRPLSLSEGDLRVLKRRDSNERCEEINYKMPNKAIENVYQPEPPSIPNINESLGDSTSCSQNRRSSDVSTASGIYEEIVDEQGSDTTASSSYYMDQLFSNRQPEEPPPLPPRQRCASDSISTSRSQEVRISQPSIIPITPSHSFIRNERNTFALQRIMDNTNYVPMSPRLKDITLYNLQTEASLQENDYVIMR